MANRSYLYAVNMVPGPDVNKAEFQSIGISEWGWEIPIVHKLLLSGNPQPCKSTIWGHPDDIAVVGDFAQGVENLRNFLGQIEGAAAQPPIQEALAFLDRTENQQRYFLLEAGEIFELEDGELGEQNAALVDELKLLETAKAAALASLKQPASEKPESLGLGSWSNALYFG